MLHIKGLLGRLFEHIALRRLDLFYLVPARVQLRQLNDAVFVRIVEGIVEFLIGAVLRLVLGHPQFKLRALDAIAHHAVDLDDGQSGLLLVLNRDFGGLAGTQIDLMGRLIQNIAFRGLNLGDDVIALGQMDVGDRHLPIRPHGEIPDLHASLGLDLKNSAGQEAPVNVHLGDRQGGPLIVLELHRCVPVGQERYLLGRSVQNVPLRDILLRDGINAGKQVLNCHCSIRASRLGGDGGAVRKVQGKGHTGNGIAGVLVRFADGQVGAPLIFDGDRAGLAGEQLNMILPHIQNVVEGGGCLLHGIHAGVQLVDVDLAVIIGDAIQIVGAVLDLGDAEMNATQPGAV